MLSDNNSITQIPVIFLAFANDRVNHSAYLRNLPNELRSIRDTLNNAVKSGLCQVVERANASIEEILDVFQEKKFKDRIAIFHYGGHANCYKLILESVTGGRAPAMKEGLVTFLARQKSLKLVFLNACSTQQHALDLKQAGIPAVIGTSQVIRDDVACNLANRFYSGIAHGIPLERAWLEAQDYIKIQKGASNFKALYNYGQEPEDRFPWDIVYKEGAEKVKKWNLPDTVNDPLFGLPNIPYTHKLPDKPFLFLERYQRRHAEVFFGRSRYVRELFNRVTDKYSPPIILLYGQSGVGKSSLLEAGLMPRLESCFTTLYLRRNQEKGALKTIEYALQEQIDSLTKQPSSILTTINEKWKYIETSSGSPLVIILDQVDEIYTQPIKQLPNEFQDCLRELNTLFANPTIYPKGKLILGYRKEFHPEIAESIKHEDLDYSHLFLSFLNRNDIIEVVNGLTSSKPLKNKYNLRVEDPLPVMIADYLLVDSKTPVAPTLQIILTKMWDHAQKDRASRYPDFTVAHFQVLQKEGVLLEDFFYQQMRKMSFLNKDAVESGLALDLLKFHTSSFGTACSRKMEELSGEYFHCREYAIELVRQLKQLYLLTDTQDDDERISLAHDTLAPIVIKAANESNRPGQRAARILASKIEDFSCGENKKGLDEYDLEIVEGGKWGMRNLNPDEEELLNISRLRKIQKERRSKITKYAGTLLIIMVMIFAVFAAWQWGVAENRGRLLKVNAITTEAKMETPKDPTKALRIMETAWALDGGVEVTRDIYKIYWENNFYKIIIAPQNRITSVAFSRTGKYILTGYKEGKTELWDRQGRLLTVLDGHNTPITCAAFSDNAELVATGSRDKRVCLWNKEGSLLKVLNGHTGWITSVTFSRDGRRILTGSRDKTATLWNRDGELLETFNAESIVNTVLFSPDGKYILIGTADGKIKLWHSNGEYINDLKNHDGSIVCIDCFCETQDYYILVGTSKGIVSFWRLSAKAPENIIQLEASVNTVSFSPDGRSILTGSDDNTVRLWDRAGNQRQKFIGHSAGIIHAAFTSDGENVITASLDNTVRLWQPKVYMVHDSPVSSAVFFQKGKFILTGTNNGVIRIWNQKGKQINVVDNLDSGITTISVSPDNKFVIAGTEGGFIHLWKISPYNLNFKKTKKFIAHNSVVLDSAFSPDSRCILTGSHDNTACLWSLDGEELAVFEGHHNRITSVAFSPNGKYIVTGSFDNTARLWDIKGNQVQVLRGHNHWVTSVAFSPDGRYILSGSYDKKALLWDMNGNVLQHFEGHSKIISSVTFSPDSRFVLTSSFDDTVRLWDLQGNELQVFKGHSDFITRVAFSPDGQRVITASRDKTARLWNMFQLEDFLKSDAIERLSGKKFNVRIEYP